MKDLFDRLLSLDIETTGTDRHNDKIWSVGVTGSSRFEKFINPTDKLSGEDAINEMGNKNSFSKAQLFNKSFDSLGSAITAGDAITSEEAMADIFKSIDKNSVIVIQNANFENRFIAEALKGHSDLGSAQDKMMYVPTDVHQQERLLYTPPKVINAGLVASSSYDDFIRTGNEDLFQESRRSMNRVMDEYEKLFKTKDKGAFVVDLMDVTKATYAEAAHKGYLSKQNVNIGTSVEFLARSLLGEAETHTALNDADQQIRIFKKLKKLRDELKTGKLSDESVTSLAKIKSGQPYEASRQFTSAIKNTLEEIQTKGSTRIIPHVGLFKGVEPTTVSSMGPNGIEEFMRPGYRKSIVTSNPNEAIEHVLKRYEGKLTKGIPNKRALIEKLKDETTTEGKIEQAKLLEKEFRGSKDTVGKVENAIKQYDKPFRGESVKDDILAIADKAKYKVKTLTPTQKGVGLAALAMGGLAGVMSLNQDEEDFKKKREQEEAEITLQNTLQIYNKPIVYHGSGFADWNERTGHHRY